MTSTIPTLIHTHAGKSEADDAAAFPKVNLRGMRTSREEIRVEPGAGRDFQ